MTNAQNSNLVDWYDLLRSCNDCLICEEVCPIYNVEKEYTPNRKIKIALKLVDSEKISEEEIEDIYACMRCGACERKCSQKIPITKIVQLSRKKLAEIGLMPETHRKIIHNILNKGLSLNKDPYERNKWINNNKIRSDAKYVYLTGCFASVMNSNIAKSTAKILSDAKIDFTVLGDKEVCCGVFALDNGMDDVTIECIEKNMNVIRSTRLKDAIVTCPACYKIYTRLFGTLVDRYDINITSIIDVVHDLVTQKIIKLKNNSCLTVVIHKSCNISDDQYKYVQDTIEKVPNVRLIDLKNNMCCGAASGVKPKFPDISIKIGSKTLEDAVEIGADILITTCPFCNFQFNDVKKRKNYDIKIADFTEFISELI